MSTSDTSDNSDLMNVGSVMIPTEVAYPGMMVRDLFQECGRAQVQALPYRDGSGAIIGRVTLKNILRVSCLPEYIVDMASLLSSEMSCVEHAEDKAREIMCSTVDPFVQNVHETIPSSAPLIKALAVMEQHDTSYIFVVDDGVYRGIVTIQGIASSMSEVAVCVPSSS